MSIGYPRRPGTCWTCWRQGTFTCSDVESESVCINNPETIQILAGILQKLISCVFSSRESVVTPVLPDLPDLRDQWEPVDPLEPPVLMVAR